jgi:hypothetical protein
MTAADIERRIRRLNETFDLAVGSPLRRDWWIEMQAALALQEIHQMCAAAMREVDAILGIREPF